MTMKPGYMPMVEVLREALPHWDEVREGDRGLLVETIQDGWTACVDGREAYDTSDQKTRGPKVQGGTLGVAMLIAYREGTPINEDVFREACQLTVESGFLPGVHDMSHGECHCGHCNLFMKGYFGEGAPTLELEPAKMAGIVKDFGGGEIELMGEHEERVVRVNFVKDTTLVPDTTAFGLDAWWIEELGLDVNFLLQNAASTVEGLNGPLVLEVIE